MENNPKKTETSTKGFSKSISIPNLNLIIQALNNHAILKNKDSPSKIIKEKIQ